MAASSFVLCLSLVLLVTTLGSSAQLGHEEPALMSTLQEISNSTAESLRLQIQSTAALSDLQTLPDMVKLLKKEIALENQKAIAAMKNEFQDVLKVEQLTLANAEQKTKLTENEKLVEQLTAANQELTTNLADNRKQAQDLDKRLQESLLIAQEQHGIAQKLNLTVQDLNNRLHESELQVQQLHSTVMKLNQTVEILKDPECRYPQLQKIQDVVERFKSSNDQLQLGADLQSALDYRSVEFQQLQRVQRDNMFTYTLGIIGPTQLTTLLLCAGLPVDTTVSDGDTILHGAALGGEVEMVKLLLRHGAQVDARGLFQYTPLMKAAFYGQLEVVKVLVQAGASTTAKDKDGRTALENARDKIDKIHTDIVQFLQQLPH